VTSQVTGIPYPVVGNLDRRATVKIVTMRYRPASII
jgi:hypothetical protein